MAERREATPDRFLYAIAIGAVVLIVVGIAVVQLTGGAPPPSAADPASPAGVVQRYIEALRAGDLETARSFLTREAKAVYDREKEQLGPRFVGSPDQSRRILIEPLTTDEQRAEVKVTISTFTARTEPFSTSTYHNEIIVHLVMEDGAWRVSTPAGPYQFIH